jgi:hypothetical protein
MKSVSLPFGDGSVQVQLPDRAQVVKASQPHRANGCLKGYAARRRVLIGSFATSPRFTYPKPCGG